MSDRYNSLKEKKQIRTEGRLVRSINVTAHTVPRKPEEVESGELVHKLADKNPQTATVLRSHQRREMWHPQQPQRRRINIQPVDRTGDKSHPEQLRRWTIEPAKSAHAAGPPALFCRTPQQ